MKKAKQYYNESLLNIKACEYDIAIHNPLSSLEDEARYAEVYGTLAIA